MLDSTYLDKDETHHQVNGLYQFKYCDKCDEIKPPRTHHCSACGKCVMKMDHHCPWVGNCVGLLTHKTFWLFVFYATLALFQVCLTTYFYTKDLQKQSYNSHITFLVIYSAAWSFALFNMTAMHTYLICKNWTTLEMAALRKEKDIFKDQSVRESWEQVMGKNKLLWFLPIGGPTPDRGLDYNANIPVVGVITEKDDADDEAAEA